MSTLHDSNLPAREAALSNGVGMQAGASVWMLFTCPSVDTRGSCLAMSAFACCTAVKALLASAATSAMPAPSSSRARWISSYLHAQEATVTRGQKGWR